MPVVTVRIRVLKIFLLLFVLSLAGAWELIISPAFAQTQTARDLVIETGGKTRHRFHVEIAATEAERTKGLMFRRELAPDAGMLFDFGQPFMAVMWMKNTLLPLDMLFIDAEGRIVNIAERTVPGSLAPISSDAPVKFVLEVNGGATSRLRIKAGDLVVSGLRP